MSTPLSSEEIKHYEDLIPCLRDAEWEYTGFVPYGLVLCWLKCDRDLSSGFRATVRIAIVNHPTSFGAIVQAKDQGAGSDLAATLDVNLEAVELPALLEAAKDQVLKLLIADAVSLPVEEIQNYLDDCTDGSVLLFGEAQVHAGLMLIPSMSIGKQSFDVAIMDQSGDCYPLVSGLPTLDEAMTAAKDAVDGRKHLGGF